jgi:adenylate kinase
MKIEATFFLQNGTNKMLETKVKKKRKQNKNTMKQLPKDRQQKLKPSYLSRYLPKIMYKSNLVNFLQSQS